MKTYETFLEEKSRVVPPMGITISEDQIHPLLYDFQKAIVKWALRKGRAAVFADCGLGKTFIQLEWARLIGKTVLIVAPLCVAKQTTEEAKKIGVDVKFVRNKSQVENGISITNYEMIENFDDNIDAIVLDESSILKSLAGKTRKRLISLFKDVPFRICCTATPCPNDIAELGNHAEFLGILTYAEMLATYFINRQNTNSGWVLKGHAHDAFYKWLASWAVCLTKPEDLGFDGSQFVLPELNVNHISIKINYRREGELFFTGMKGIKDRSLIRHATVDDRVRAVVKLIENSDGNQWICWCGRNDEANKLTACLGDIAVNVQGSDSLEKKEEAIWDFLAGRKRILVTKPKIAGFGMNFQNACNTAFVGLSDSYESYYQCIRRLWRFGQNNPVNANIILTNIESDIYKNVIRKERQAKKLSTEIVKNIEEFERIEIAGNSENDFSYDNQKHEGKNWVMYQGDCVDVSSQLSDDSIDFSVYSPPFIDLYVYTATPRDIGNSRSEKEFFDHYSFLIKQLFRITKPGRNTAVHVSQIPAQLISDGYIGLKDFRGKVCVAYENNGWIYHGEVVIQKNPQSQAIRTHAKGLLFAQLKRDGSWLRPGLADYVLIFRKPGENQVPIKPDVTNDEWIKFAHPVWFDIKETNVLNKLEAKTDKDSKHICPLQLDVIDRCVRLWSNPGEIVFSPFAGIGSEGYQALKRKRRFIGIELKPEYVKAAIKNLKMAELDEQGKLF